MESLVLSLAAPILQGHVEQVQNGMGIEGTECSLWVFSNCPKLVFDWQVVATCFLIGYETRGLLILLQNCALGDYSCFGSMH
jgi:hypothetical protein